MAVRARDSLPPGPPPSPPPRQSPLLMLPLEEDEDGHGCRFFSIKDKTALALRGFPEVFSESRCVGSSHGWLVLLDKGSEPYLLDPLLGGRRVLRLPPVETFPCVLRVFRSDDDGCGLAALYETVHLGCWRNTTLLSLQTLSDYIVSKAVLSANPNDVDKGKSCWVVVIFGSESKLAFCGCKDFGGGGAWTELTGIHAPYSDVIFYDGTLFALCNNGFVEAWDFNRDSPIKIMEIKSSFPPKSAEAAHALRKVCFTNSYLVEAGGEILLLVRFAGYFVNGDGVPVEEDYLLTEEDTHPLVCPYRTLYFHVYMLDMNTEEWMGLDSIGHRAVFVGGSQSASVSARDFPELEANSVYFTDDYWEPAERDDLYGGHDMGVYNLQSGKVKEICELGSDKIEPPPFWVFPSDYRSKRG
ncbi:F-box protein SKIP23-like [Rhodamnia argentea]|uniref:F-box protein SKIP23-like n=1 Tax=Rhodamnia argentea TaxID=178133 RepID=A0A8B8PI97_9MYRT|nr:F-box protein SKIP23-like [Rhodamnia argentea]